MTTGEIGTLSESRRLLRNGCARAALRPRSESRSCTTIDLVFKLFRAKYGNKSVLTYTLLFYTIS